ncbi:MAG: hypothetical protein IPJ30_03445 [Acidobacteria bacterium]|nr:hypothetical protein [Acidobacteriota bacterium]
MTEARETRGDNEALSYKQVFEFDRFGNLFRKATSNPTTGQDTPIVFTPIEPGDIDPAKNRFTSASGTAYNDNGQVVTDGKFRNLGYGYDANGRMVLASEANKPDAVSVYDALGNRVAEKVDDVWQFVIYDAFGKLVAEYGGTAPQDEGGVRFYLQDWQGSVRAGLNAGGFVKSRTDNQAFGEPIEAGIGLRTTAQGFGAPASTRQGYGLTEKDSATGLNHTWFRKNENRAGRWTSPDPYNGSASVGNPQSWNRYSYVVSQPTNYVDPSGLSFYVCFDIVTYGGYDNQPGHTYAHTETVCFVFGGGVPGGGTFDTAGNPGSGGGGDECPPGPTVCQAQKDQEAARNFGRKLALREREQKKKFLECFEREMKEVRRQLSNLMDKHFGKWKVKVGLGAGLGLLSAAGPGIGALGGSAVALWDWKVELDEFNRDSFEPTRRAAIETCRAESGYRGRI